MNNQGGTKFCKYCGGKIPEDAVVCTLCGRQVEELKSAPNNGGFSNGNNNGYSNGNNNGLTAVNNTFADENNNAFSSGSEGVVVDRFSKNKWVALILCFFFGYFGVHKFYEGKIGMGVLYLFTFGLFFVGCITDFIILLFKPTKYYV